MTKASASAFIFVCRFDSQECRLRDITYSAVVKVCGRAELSSTLMWGAPDGPEAQTGAMRLVILRLH
eukprot:2577610-Pleurochrysis_carterae.AAC.2